MLNKRRYLNEEIWTDSPMSITLAVATLGLAVSCMFLTAGFLSDAPFLLYSPLLVAFLLIVSGYYEKHPVPRAVAWGLAWLVVALTGLLVVIGTAVNGGGTGRAVLTCFGLLILPTAGVGYAIWQAILSYRKAVAASLDQMLIDLVELRSEVSFDEAQQELGEGKTAVLHRAETLHTAGRLTGAVDPSNEMLYSLAGLAKKQAQVASIIQARGQMALPDLSTEMKVPTELLRQWLYQQVRLRHFSGFVDWVNEIVYSRQRDQLQAQQTCPNCAAELNLAGQGIIGCQYCQAEIFI